MEWSSQQVAEPSRTDSSDVLRNDLPLPSKKVPDYLLWSIANTCCCVFVFGLVALEFSKRVRKYRQAGEITKANKFSTCALTFNIISTVAGLAVWGALYLCPKCRC